MKKGVEQEVGVAQSQPSHFQKVIYTPDVQKKETKNYYVLDIVYRDVGRWSRWAGEVQQTPFAFHDTYSHEVYTEVHGRWISVSGKNDRSREAAQAETHEVQMFYGRAHSHSLRCNIYNKMVSGRQRAVCNKKHCASSLVPAVEPRWYGVILKFNGKFRF